MNQERITNHKSLIWNDEYYVIAGNSTVNQEEIKNNKLIKYNFKTNSWQSLGNLNFEFNDDEVHVTSYKEYFYIFDGISGLVTTINVEKMETKSYPMTSGDEFSNGQLGNNQIVFVCDHLYTRLTPEKSLEKQKHLFEQGSINYFVANNSTYQASIFKSYLMTDFIDLKSKRFNSV